VLEPQSILKASLSPTEIKAQEIQEVFIHGQLVREIPLGLGRGHVGRYGFLAGVDAVEQLLGESVQPRPGSSLQADRLHDQPKEITMGLGNPGRIQQEGMVKKELRFRPSGAFSLPPQGLQHLVPPEQKVEERIGPGTGKMKWAQTLHKRQPETLPFRRQEVELPGWIAALPLAFISITYQ